MKYLYLFLLVITCTVYKAQPVSISVSGLKSVTGHLYSIQGENTFLIDSVKSSGDGIFKYQFDQSKRPGFYRLTFQNNKFIDFLFDREAVTLRTSADNISDSMNVTSSESNRVYYEFIKINRLYKTKTDLLQIILARYPKDDDYYNTTAEKLKRLQDAYASFITNVNKRLPDSFIARYVKSAQLPIIDMSLPLDQQLKYLRSHALDKVNFNDYQMIYSDLFANKSIEYLSYYRNPQLTKEMLEKEFMAAVDTLLNRAKVNQIVYQQVTEYLIDGFKRFGFDQIIDYIVSNYVIKDDLCLDTKTESSIQKRIDQNKKLPLNAAAPNIILPDTSDHEVDMSKMKSDKVLVVFYASWCPHCQTLIPQLNEFIKSHKEMNIDVLAVSIDNKRTDWINFIRNNNLSFLNVSDMKGWDSRSAADYYVYATPTMFLLNRERKIIGKPITLEELKNLLR